MAFQSSPDIVVHIRSETTSSERRINASWTLSHFKGRLEPITGIPSSAQNLTLSHGAPNHPAEITASDEEHTQLAHFQLEAYSEIYVHDTRPQHLRAASNLTSAADVDKYTMPVDSYESLDNTVLSYKKAHKLGRFDPDAPTQLAAQVAHIQREVEERNIGVGKRCRLLPPQNTGLRQPGDDDRRGLIAFVGTVDAIPGPEGAAWIGVKLDEPVGKNDGTAGGVRYFDAGGAKRGVFVRPGRIDVGDFKELGLELDEDMEEM